LFVFHAKNSTDSPDEEWQRLVTKIHNLLSLLESLSIISETACHPDCSSFVWRRLSCRSYCLSAGCFVREGGRFRNI